MTRSAFLCSLIALTSLAACASADSAGGVGEPNTGLAQGGAQDFGQFRAILDAGQLPGPETFDDVGFFNEHKIELPDPECAGPVCLHGELGVMGNMITGSNCTLMLLGMNTAIDADEIERPHLNLAIAVDTSGSMKGAPIDFLREGLLRMLDDLEPDDRVTLVRFSDDAEVLVEAIAGDDAAFPVAITGLQANGSTNIYDGLRTAYEVVQEHATPSTQNRVILLSDGEATTGITSSPKIVAMSAAYNEAGFGLTTIGMGTEFDPALMRELSESGGGAFYYLEDPSAVREVFEEEVKGFLVPIAQDVVLDVEVDPGYRLRSVYGTKHAATYANLARIEIPVLQLAHRTSADDQAGGRRGGGGGIIVELLPDAAHVAEEGVVGHLSLRYRVPNTGETVEESFTVENSLAPGEAPEAGLFTSSAVEKSFVMLNVFAGFDMAATRAAYGDYNGALGVLLPLREGVDGWLAAHDDADIEDDLVYVDRFIDNLMTAGGGAPPPEQNPAEPWPAD